MIEVYKIPRYVEAYNIWKKLYMYRDFKENEQTYLSGRVRKTAEARIISSSQMPVDFFGHHRSFHVSSRSKPKLLIKNSPHNIFEEFISMFKMSKGLKKMAKQIQ